LLLELLAGYLVVTYLVSYLENKWAQILSV
jgi:hypothetical protein